MRTSTPFTNLESEIRSQQKAYIESYFEGMKEGLRQSAYFNDKGVRSVGENDLPLTVALTDIDKQKNDRLELLSSS